MALPEEVIESSRIPKISPYSQAIRAGGLIYTAGQPGIDPSTGAVAGDSFEAQARQAFANLRAVLEDSGSRLERVVKVTCYVADADAFPTLNRLFAEFFPHSAARAFDSDRGITAGAAFLDRCDRGRRTLISSFLSLKDSPMQMSGIPFGTTDWSQVERIEYKGERGVAYWRTQDFGAIRVRMVEYTPGYLADHWCVKGHILLCTEGELHTELDDGRTFTLKPGMSYQVADNAEAHRSHTECGAKLFIVD